jgi:hypothetical protein
MRGRSDPKALSPANLTGFEQRGGRIEATFVPPGWGDLNVRAAWTAVDDATVDLEIQALVLSPGLLPGLEIQILSTLPEPKTRAARSQFKRWVEPRDTRAGGLSYDGREVHTRGLTTLPPADSEGLLPRILPSPWEEGWSYVEMTHPRDAARRITEAGSISSLGHTTRYGLFGHDLEKGVVLRARLRGVWLRDPSPARPAQTLFEQFLQEPLPLGP